MTDYSFFFEGHEVYITSEAFPGSRRKVGEISATDDGFNAYSFEMFRGGYYHLEGTADTRIGALVFFVEYAEELVATELAYTASCKALRS